MRSNYSAYSRSARLRGYWAYVEPTENEIRMATECHIRGPPEDGLVIPQLVSIVKYLEVAA